MIYQLQRNPIISSLKILLRSTIRGVHIGILSRILNGFQLAYEAKGNQKIEKHLFLFLKFQALNILTPANKLRAKCFPSLHGLYGKPLGFFTSASFASLWLVHYFYFKRPDETG